MAPLFKQNFVSAILIGLLITYRIRLWKPFTIAAIGLPLIIVTGLVVSSAGGFLEICLRYPSLPEKSMNHAISVFIMTFLKTPSNLLLVVGLCFAVTKLPIRKSGTTSHQQIIDSNKPFILWLVMSGLLAFLTSQRKLGGSPLYWYEFLVVAAILTGRLVNQYDSQVGLRPFHLRFYLVWSLALFMVASVFYLRSLRGNYFEWAARPYYQELQEIIESKTPIDEPTLVYFSELTRKAGRKVFFNDPLLFNQTTPENRQLLHGMIKARAFSCLLLQPQNAEDYLTNDYIEVKTTNPFPDKIFAVKLYLRSDLVRP
jgi:hypothetical protein